MGILSNLISSELDKKKQERQFQLQAYGDLLQSGRVKPGQEAAAWDMFKKAAPKEGHGLLEIFKPILLGKHKQQAGAAPDAGGGQPKDSPLYSPEEMEDQKLAREKKETQQKDALALEQSAKLQKQKDDLERASKTRNRADDLQEVERVRRDQTMSEEAKQDAISLIFGRAPEQQSWQSGVMTLPNGSNVGVMYSTKGTPKFLLGGTTPFTPPPGSSSPKSWADFEREKKEADDAKKPAKPTEAAEKDTEAFDAYKEKHHITGTLTASQKLAARGEAAAATETPDIKAQREATLESTRQRIADQKRTAEGKAVAPGTPEYTIAEGLAEGSLTMQDLRTLTAYGRNTEQKMAIFAKAKEINPDLKIADLDIAFKYASSPKVQAQIGSLKNVKSGVPDLLKASDAAVRSGATLLNKAVIPGGIAIGAQKYSDFATARVAFADELSGALGYGSATDMSRDMGFSMTDANLSPENFRSAVQGIVIPFVNRKIKSIAGQMGPYGAPLIKELQVEGGAESGEDREHDGHTYHRDKAGDPWKLVK